MKKQIERHEKLQTGHIYHVYNKSISSDKLFIDKQDYMLFLKRLKKFILPVAEILSYCLITNHFHILAKIKQLDEIEMELMTKVFKPEQFIGQQFSNFFNSYSRSFNYLHKRAGRLFLYPYKRILVEEIDYLRYLICYIHKNPIHHGLVRSYGDWEFSSFNSILSGEDTIVNSKASISAFGNGEKFLAYHLTFQVRDLKG
jgi:hypothetical protein